MRILFISNYFPGDLGPLARELAATPGNEVVFASNRQRREFSLPGVRRVRLKNSPPLFGGALPSVPRLWEEVLARGSAGLRSFQSLLASWGTPDIVLASLAGGAAFFAPQAFPDAFFVTYAESGLKNYSLLPAQARNAWALVQSALFLQGELSFAFSEDERRMFPPHLREHIRLVPPCVDTDIFSRAAAEPWAEGDADGATGGAATGAGGLLLTLNAVGTGGRSLAALLELGHAALRALPDCRVVMLTENSSRSQALEAAAARWADGCRARLSVHDSLPFLRYRDLLAASSLVVCPGSGEAAERAMLQCMSCETLLMARAGAANFLRPGVNMLELPPQAPVEAVLAALESRRHGGEPLPQARMARRNVLAHFSEATVVPRHLAQVMQAWAAWRKERPRTGN